MEPATASLEALLRYQEMLFLLLLAMLTIGAFLMTFFCLLLLWFDRPPTRRHAASCPRSAPRAETTVARDGEAPCVGPRAAAPVPSISDQILTEAG